MKNSLRFPLVLFLALSLALTVASAQNAVPAPPISAPTVQTAPLPGSNVAPGSAVDPYSILTSDPAVGRAIAYLTTLGAPAASQGRHRPDLSGWELHPLDPGFHFNPQTGASSTVIAGLAAMFPNVAANDLARDGVIVLTSLLYNVPVPGVNVSTGTSTSSPSPLAVPQSPLGPTMNPGTPDAIGDSYYDSPFDTFPLGHVYTDPSTGHQFTKMGSASPFGILGAHWQRTA